MKHLHVLLVTVAAIALSGCQATTAPPSPSPSAADGSATILEVWDKIGCEQEDPLGTRGILGLSPSTAPVLLTGSCTPYEDGGIAFFYELESVTAAEAWLAGGGLEIGSTDAVFVDGAVVILATDARTAQEFAALFEAKN